MSDTAPPEVAGASAFATKPCAFFSYFWPEMIMYEKQLSIAQSVSDNKKTFVHTGNELGKTRVAALIALWFFSSRSPAIVVTSSSSEKQLKGILWQEMSSLVQSAARPLDAIRLQSLDAQFIDQSTGIAVPKHYIAGHVTRQVENFQGHHLPEDTLPRVLFIFDESSGVGDEFYDATDSQAHRILVIGNPLNTTNFFYRECRSGNAAHVDDRPGLQKKVIHIDALDSPNVIAGMLWKKRGYPGKPPQPIPGVISYEEYVERLATWDRFKQHTRLHGKFPEGSADQLFPIEALDIAQDNFSKTAARDTRRAMGVDVAGGGRDKSSWCVVDRFGVIEQFSKDTPDTMEIAGITIQLMKKHDIADRSVTIDAGGGGKQIGDRLWEQNIEVRVINFGQSATDKKAYANKRAEMYGRLSTALQQIATFDTEGQLVTGFTLPPNCNALREDLNVLPDSRDSEGRLKLPPKDRATDAHRESKMKTIRQMLGRSPDDGDAAALAWEALGIRVRPPRPTGAGLIATSKRPQTPKADEQPARQSAISKRLDDALGPETSARR